MLPQSLTFHSTLHRALWRDYRNNRAAIEAYRDRSLKSLLRHAKQNVPFQQSRLGRVNLDRIDLEVIPPTDKNMMMAAFDATVANGVVNFADVLKTDEAPHTLELPIIKGKYIVVKTSGTSGKPSWLVCTVHDWAIQLGATYSRMVRYWLTPARIGMSLLKPIRTATIAAEHAHSMTWQGAVSAGTWAGPFGRSKFFSVIDSVDNIVEGYNQFRADHLHAYPTAAEMLARYQLDGRGTIHPPKIITVGSEALTTIARETIVKAFPSSRLVDHYGMSECLPLSTECRHGRKHINADYAILEARDAGGNPVPDGELSDHVLVTNLTNKLQPIIRYRVEDCVRITREGCPCGSVFPVVDVYSRKGSLIHLQNDDGNWQIFSPPVAVDTMLHTHGVSQYQIVHVRQNEMEVRYQPLPEANSRDVEKSIRDQFRSVMGRLKCSNSVVIDIRQVEGFERTAGGNKLQQMISQVAAPGSSAISRSPSDLKLHVRVKAVREGGSLAGNDSQDASSMGSNAIGS